MKKIQLIFLQIAIICFSLSSCNLDQIESSFPDYNSAHSAGLFNHSWIPQELIFKSMTDIHQKTDLDLNTCIFAYKLAGTDIDSLSKRIFKTRGQNRIITNISLPKWFNTKVHSSNWALYDKRESDTVFIIIDKSQSKVFGWRNNK
jgi:hypothetical protein